MSVIVYCLKEDIFTINVVKMNISQVLYSR